MTQILVGFFDWVLRTSWQAAILVLIILAAQWAFQKKLTPRWRYALWMLVLVRLIMPVHPKSAASVYNYTALANPPVQALLPNAFPRESLPPEPPVPSPTATRSPVTDPPFHAADPALSIPQHSTPPTFTVHPVESANALPTVSRTDCFRVIPAIIWAIGAGLLLLRITLQNITFTLGLRQAREAVEFTELLQRCKLLFKTQAPIRLYETDLVKSPALYGFFRYRLLLPVGMTAQFASHELRHVFLHELAHVQRRDMFVQSLVTALQILHWFNPVLWFAFHRMAVDREMAADELALTRAGDRENLPYGETIVKLLEHLSNSTTLPGLMGILEDKHQMARRISMIAAFKKPSRWPILATLILPMLVLISLTDARTRTETVAMREVADESLRPVVTNGPTVKVHVVDAKTGAPIEGAEVIAPGLRLINGESDGELPKPHWFTDSAGLATIRLGEMPDSTTSFSVSVRHVNYAPRGACWLVERSPDDSRQLRTKEITVHLVRGGTIGGQVIGPSGTPCNGVQVLVSGPGTLPNRAPAQPVEYPEFWTRDAAPVVTDREGRWHIDHFPSNLNNIYIDTILPDGSRQLFIHKPLTIFEPPRHPLNLAELRAGTARLDLLPGNTVRGILVDSAGRPLSNARIMETPGIRGYRNLFRTDRDGRFELPNRIDSQLVLTAEPDNCAMVSAVVKVGPNTPEVRLQAPPLQPLHIFVLGTNGLPLPGAKVSYDPYSADDYAPDFSGITDTAGALTWTNAPLVRLALRASSPSGNMSLLSRTEPKQRSLTLKLRSASDSQIIVTGEVLEAETGRPVKGLQVAFNTNTPGIVRNYFNPPTVFADKSFRLAVPRNNYWLAGFRLRVTAENCQPLITDARQFEEGDWHAKFELHRAVKVRASVSLPNGAPAAGATVTLMENDSFALAESANAYPECQTVRTGPEGEFEFDHPGADYTVVIQEDAGFLQTTVEQLQKQPRLRLQAWGRVEGKLRMSDSPPLDFQIWLNAHQSMDRRWYFQRPQYANKDRFVFDKVPPGDLYLSRRFDLRVPINEGYQMPIHVKPGKTTYVDYPGKGRLIVGKLTGGFDWPHDRHLLVLKPNKVDESSPGIGDSATFKDDMNRTRESIGRWLNSKRDYPLELHPDGSFRIVDVPPGKYELRIRVTKPQNDAASVTFDPFGFDTIGTLERDVVIPDGGSDKPLDLGTLAVSRLVDQ